ncbi:tRNA (adenosine(37)-N6)-dimethylallyltransferase MiaA [Allobranchiibius sp. CTAmp26]|uniref:tRNA (adenosine(37)-N6)-dimethylallyltransferase MiaA n=1 Tax=Allobranchiibius sp. CTAmp26 TaxID=2815214 RepID=UPI001AA1A94B|nr:tRNA (adenosine(37)-N6)-dimethylallyltransferase MiaA [Allobranchiibius sp. CTAmp26]MBO1755175.1 tRNA (adenosine(37)-N6)-dimethylallyltransferase MiaA [Allobranchiibius sp. CTAmp26]
MDAGGAAVVVAVVGATATGKSHLGLHLADALGGEIVNADASQLYRGMDIGTAKLPMAERHGIPHHLLDVLDVREESTLAAYQERVTVAIDDVCARGRTPILVGGSGLYARAALDVLEIPPTDPAVRVAWEDRLETDGPDVLHAQLRERDPAAARAIGPANGRRLVRALEVIELTGRPFSATMPTRTYRRPAVQVGLRADRTLLHDRIGHRAAQMWADGLLGEVRGLDAQGLRTGRTASRAIGYAQALRQLDGVLTQDEAINETALFTRRFARRQVAWFRADPRITWLEHDDPGLTERALELIRAVRP